MHAVSRLTHSVHACCVSPHPHFQTGGAGAELLDIARHIEVLALLADRGVPDMRVHMLLLSLPHKPHTWSKLPRNPIIHRRAIFHLPLYIILYSHLF